MMSIEPLCVQGAVALVENDLLPRLEVEWEGEDLSTVTKIELHVEYQDGSGVLTREAVIDDANPGGTGTARFHFDWQTGDLKKGYHFGEFEFSYPGSPAKTLTIQGFALSISREIA